jgi:hypothetical protein
VVKGLISQSLITFGSLRWTFNNVLICCTFTSPTATVQSRWHSQTRSLQNRLLEEFLQEHLEPMEGVHNIWFIPISLSQCSQSLRWSSVCSEGMEIVHYRRSVLGTLLDMFWIRNTSNKYPKVIKLFLYINPFIQCNISSYITVNPIYILWIPSPLPPSLYSFSLQSLLLPFQRLLLDLLTLPESLHIECEGKSNICLWD